MQCPPGGEGVLRCLQLLEFRALLSRRHDHRACQHPVSIQGGHPDTLHDRVRVLDPVPRCPCHGIHHDAFRLHVHVHEQDVELLADVHVDRALGHKRVPVGEGGSRDGPIVVLFHPVQEQILTGTCLGDSFHHLVVLLKMVVARNDKRHIHSPEHVADNFDRLPGRTISFFGMRSFQPDAYHVGAVFLHADAGHLSRVVEEAAVDLAQHRWVFIAGDVKHLHCHQGPKWHLSLEQMKRHTALPPDRVRPAPGSPFFRRGAQLNLPDRNFAFLFSDRKCRHLRKAL